MSTPGEVAPCKDEENEHAVPSAWRPILKRMADALVQGDYECKTGLSDVRAVDSSTADQARSYVLDYGEKLVELPADTWSSSIASWQSNRWDVLVDLWTESEGCSDLVMQVEVYEVGSGYEFQLYMVYVP